MEFYIYITNEGFIKLTNTNTAKAIKCTQNQYENIITKSLFQDFCITPLNNFEQYNDGDCLKDNDIPENVEFDFPDDEFSDCNYTEGELLNMFKEENRINIMEAFEDEISDDTYFIDNQIIKCTQADRFNLQIMTSQNKPFYFNGVFYPADELKLLRNKIENEILKIFFYKEALLSLCDSLTNEDRNNRNFIEWGLFNEDVCKEMKKYEQPFN